MLILVIGGSGSGKSAYAEKRVMECGYSNRFYLATMMPYGEEGIKTVNRHRKLRNGKGFITIEQPRDISNIIDKVKGNDNVVLLECTSNLVANEMFLQDKIEDENIVVNKILDEIRQIENKVGCMVVVTNDVFSDGCTYSAETMSYLNALGKINHNLALISDEVVEVVVGIPVICKKK